MHGENREGIKTYCRKTTRKETLGMPNVDEKPISKWIVEI
jgi:hypothetical protein